MLCFANFMAILQFGNDIVVRPHSKFFLCFHFYDTLLKMLNFFYVPIKLISRQATA